MKNRENNFGVARLAAAVLVIMGHMHVLTGREAPILVWDSVHRIGVAVFFVISGYLTAASWMRDPDIFRYLAKRIFRIFPALVFAVLVSVFLAGPLATELGMREYFAHSLTWGYLRNMLLLPAYQLPGVFTGNPYPDAVNGSLWCLPVEFLMYLVIPLWLGFGKKCGRAGGIFWTGSAAASALLGAFWASGGGISGIRILSDGSAAGRIFGDIIKIIPYEIMGCLAYACRLEKYLSLQVSFLLLAAASGFSFVPVFFSGAASYLLLPYGVLSFALAQKPRFVKVNGPDISYGIYLFSFPIQQMLVQACMRRGLPLNVHVLAALAVPASLAAGYVTQRLVERPAAGLLKKWMTDNGK